MKRIIAAVFLALSLVTFAVPASLLAAPQQAPQQQSQTVNINTAGLEELVKLPGIGKVTAERIIAWRQANGPFASVDDLVKVKGVGKKTLEKLRASLVAE